ncbi:nuclear transport factor 2 family protein [Flavobacterium frigidarium]|jgi:hypothetical protein|uniref:Nuclear transport factor 2 family protein n=1 Tax=Flavobacterium frigidarium TaxID=99286 RepID=A0ABV4KES8_9FLAO
MKLFKLLPFLLLLFVSISYSQKQTNTLDVNKEAVIAVMKTYKDAIQNLTTKGTIKLFTDNSEVFESGGIEGSYLHYVEHHLGPELEHFKSFSFSDYKIDVQVDGAYAFTTETYIYTIEVKPNDKGESKIIKKKGVATSILKNINGEWKISKTHSSSRNTK